MSRNPYLYLFLMAAVTYAVRVLPLTLLKRRITNPILHSFLYYVPDVTLAVMTFPAMVQATQSPISGFLALAVGAVVAWRGGSLFLVAVSACAAVFLCELALGL